MSDFARLVYAAADSLHISLIGGSKSIEGQENVTVSKNNLSITFPVSVKHDFVRSDEIGIFIHFRLELWGYLVATAKGNKIDLAMMLFRGVDDNKAAYRTGSKKNTFASLKKHAVAYLTFNGDKWVEENLDTLALENKRELSNLD